MTTKPLAVLFAAALFSTTAFSQASQPANDFKPSVTNQPGQEYPMVNSQGYARFRINAPKADSVKVSLGLGDAGGQGSPNRTTASGPAPPRDQWTRASTTTT